MRQEPVKYMDTEAGIRQAIAGDAAAIQDCVAAAYRH